MSCSVTVSNSSIQEYAHVPAETIKTSTSPGTTRHCVVISFWKEKKKKNNNNNNKAFYLSVNYSNSLIQDNVFTSPTGNRIAVVPGHPSHAKV